MSINLLIGLPGSGKSHYCKQNLTENTLIINRDHIRTMIKGEYVYDINYEPFVARSAYSMVENAVKDDFDIYVDETNLTALKRKAYFNFGCDVNAIYFKPSEYNLSNRLNDQRGYSKVRWAGVIDNMRKIIEEPTFKEGFKNIIYVEVEDYRSK